MPRKGFTTSQGICRSLPDYAVASEEIVLRLPSGEASRINFMRTIRAIVSRYCSCNLKQYVVNNFSGTSPPFSPVSFFPLSLFSPFLLTFFVLPPKSKLRYIRWSWVIIFYVVHIIQFLLHYNLQSLLSVQFCKRICSSCKRHVNYVDLVMQYSRGNRFTLHERGGRVEGR